MEARERILIIESSEEVINLLNDRILNPSGYETLVATNGQEGLRRVTEERPDLILLDLHMPDITGLEIVEALHDTGPAIPIVLMIFPGSEEIAVETFRLGVKNYVVKPLEPRQVVEAIEDTLRPSRLRREKQLLTEELMRTNQRLEQRVRELTMLSDITQTMITTQDVQTLLSSVVDASVSLTKADEGMLFLIAEETGQLYLRAAKGTGEERARILLLPAHDSLIGQVVKTGEPLRIASPDPRLHFSVKTGYMVNSLLYVPMKFRGEVVGVLGVSNRVGDRSFSRTDHRRLELLAGHAVLALEAAKVHEPTRGQIANAFRETLASVSRYLYEPLKAFATNTYALKAGAERGRISCPDATLDRLLNSMERRIEQMATLTEILNDFASPEGTTKDWENLQQRFDKLKARYAPGTTTPRE
jgi:two-component system NtrC family sensor kinase